MKKLSNKKHFWKKRSVKYDNLQWVNKQNYINAFIKAGEFKKSDIVLDVGTGTGVIAHAISSHVKEVIGLDISQDMLEHSNWHDNKYFIRRDLLNPIFKEEVFDKLTARMVFHHILKDTQKAMNECYRLLKKKGKMVLSEGVPPSIDVKEDYAKIFKLKEERLTFMPQDLHKLMKKAGFKNIKTEIVLMKHMSINNWIENSGLPENTQKTIYRMHIEAGDYFKRAYNMKVTDEDCYIDMQSAILVGTK